MADSIYYFLIRKFSRTIKFPILAGGSLVLPRDSPLLKFPPGLFSCSVSGCKSPNPNVYRIPECQNVACQTAHSVLYKNVWQGRIIICTLHGQHYTFVFFHMHLKCLVKIQMEKTLKVTRSFLLENNQYLHPIETVPGEHHAAIATDSENIFEIQTMFCGKYCRCLSVK
jgi:hypothetical protein